MLLLSRSGFAIDSDRSIPGFREFHDRLIANEANLACDEIRLDYALVHLDALKRDTHSPRFVEALALVEGSHAVG